jgi:hypothetical protein
MKYQDIAEFLDAKPFVPLRVKLADGRTFKIPQRYGVLLSSTFLEIGKNPTKSGVFRGAEFHAVESIEKVEPLKVARHGVRRAS